jgi:hypothetical protein
LDVNKLKSLGFGISIPLEDGLDYLCFDHLPDII